MGNDYHYLDPENKYTDKNGLLRNLADIKDEKVLLAFESLKVTKRVEELIENLRRPTCLPKKAGIFLLLPHSKGTNVTCHSSSKTLLIRPR